MMPQSDSKFRTASSRDGATESKPSDQRGNRAVEAMGGYVLWFRQFHWTKYSGSYI